MVSINIEEIFSHCIEQLQAKKKCMQSAKFMQQNTVTLEAAGTLKGSAEMCPMYIDQEKKP